MAFNLIKEQPRLALILPMSLDGIGFVDRIIIKLALLSAAALLTSSCASSQYMGLSLIPGEAPTDLQNLAARAHAGDKQAQLDLGIRFEEGRGVPRDRRKAIRLYEQAAADSGGTTWVYSPPVGKEASGRAVPISGQPKSAGLVEAKRRLDFMK